MNRPRARVVGQPRAGLRRAGRGARSSSSSWRSRRPASSAWSATSRACRRPHQPLRARIRAPPLRPTACAFDPLGHPGGGRARLQRGGHRGRTRRRRPPLRAGRAAVRARCRARGPPRQRGRGVARRFRDLHRRGRAGPLRPAARAGGRAGDPPEEVPTLQARAAMPAEVPLAEGGAQRGPRLAAGARLAQDDFSLIGRGLRDLLHQPRRRALYPRSMELVERAEELGAVGATISAPARPCCSGATGSRPGRSWSACAAEAADCEVRRVTFAPGGADVRAL